jgi:hypothetical protein
MFEIDSCTPVFADDYLQFVVPSVGTSANLNTSLNLARSAEHVTAQVCTGSWFGVI